MIVLPPSGDPWASLAKAQSAVEQITFVEERLTLWPKYNSPTDLIRQTKRAITKVLSGCDRESHFTGLYNWQGIADVLSESFPDVESVPPRKVKWAYKKTERDETNLAVSEDARIRVLDKVQGMSKMSGMRVALERPFQRSCRTIPWENDFDSPSS